jgi:hypothetical protein
MTGSPGRGEALSGVAPIGLRPMRVNVDNFVRAETHRMFSDLQCDAAGVNRFFHNREPAAVDR